jgi:2-polyprenyl-3-methyl-5-hydroxy-6-metoxy-1,4-benzoquinol methylase
MDDQADVLEADRALKQKHRAMWASGDYAALADEMLLELGAVLVEACGINARQRVLDIAAGTGNAAIPAAMMGAKVVASDLTPELFEAGPPGGRQPGRQPGVAGRRRRGPAFRRCGV